MTSQRSKLFLKSLKERLGARSNRYTKATVTREMGEFIMAGRGRITNDLCGEFKSLYKVAGEDKYLGTFMTCKKLHCPKCFESTSSIKAKLMALKLLARARYRNRQIKHISLNITLRTFHHLNIQDKQFDYNTFKLLRLRLSHFLRSIGIEYGYLVFHSHRLQDSDTLKISPHFHLIGVGHMPETKLFYNTFGWTYRNHGVRKYGFNVKATIAYLLSHCAFVPGKPSYYWFQLDKTYVKFTQYNEVKRDENGKPYQKVDELGYRESWGIYQTGIEDDFEKVKDKPYLDLDDDIDNYLVEEFIITCLKAHYFNLTIRSEIFDVPDRLMQYWKSKQYDLFDKLMKIWEKQFIQFLSLCN